ncbi:hypothetical protein MBLNU459_g4052t2 [Dothideomycetes sp. NU459]
MPTPVTPSAASYPTPLSSRPLSSSHLNGDESPSVSKVKRSAEGLRSQRPTKKGCFSWAKVHRQALLLMQTRFKLSWVESARVFNDMFEEDISNQGLTLMAVGPLTAQYHESKKNRGQWREICKTPLSGQEAAELEDIVKRIARIAGRAIPRPPPQAFEEPVQAAAPVPIRSPVPAAQPSQPSQTTSQVPDITVEPRSQRLLIGPNVIQTYRYVPVTAEEAHPPLPALLYRYSDEKSYGVNDSQGFVASALAYIQGGCPPPPSAEDPNIFWFFENHLNRNPVSSPFISVSFSLFWVVRQALKQAAKGVRCGRITIINAQVAGAGNRAFFVPPFHQQLKNKKVFTRYAWTYRGSHEFVIWGAIPANAILCNMSLQDLEARVSRLPHVRTAMRFDLLSMPGIGNTRVRKRLQEHARPLTLDLTVDLARLLLSLGVDATAPPARIAKLVSDFIQGWAINVERDSSARWNRLAAPFAFELNSRNASEAQLRAVEEAFLYGLKSGLGDFNWQASPQKTGVMQRRVARAGLESLPTSSLTRRCVVEAVEIEASLRSRVNLDRYRSDARTVRNPTQGNFVVEDENEDDNILYETGDQRADEQESDEYEDEDGDMVDADQHQLTNEDLEYMSDEY